MKAIIWDNESPPQESLDGVKVLWKSYSNNDTPNTVSVSELIEKDSENLKSRYLFVYDLGLIRSDEKSLFEFFKITDHFNCWGCH